MKPVPIKSELFALNRARLRKLLPPKSVVVLNANDLMPTNADGTMGHHQNADLFYLTGVQQEETLLLLAPDAFEEKHREVLFVRQPNELLAIWEGHKLSQEEATHLSGISQVKWLADFPNIFRQVMVESAAVYLNANEHPRSTSPVETRDRRFVREVKAQYPLHRCERLAPLMHELRVVKSAREVELIRQACQLTGRGFRRVLRKVKPGVNETEIEAEFAHEFIRHRGVFAYPPIIAAGQNNCVLHYNQNDQPCRAGQLVLLDVAAALGNYASDLTRTIPVSGRFTRRQRKVYDAVLRTLRHITKSMTPGKTTRDLRAETEAFLTEECLQLGLLKAAQVRRQKPGEPAVRKYFMHGVAHSIGLDVHDVSYPHQRIAPGWMLTCEPAIYIPEEGFGIRLENTILVTDEGQEDLMADIPMEAEEIEAWMHRKKQ